MLDQASLAGILVVFMTIVLISGNFDLSVAAAAAISGAAALYVVGTVGGELAIVAAIGVGVVIGLVNGVLVQYVGVNAFIVTLGTLTMLRGLFVAITEGQSVNASGSLDSFDWIATSQWALDPALVIVGVVVIAWAAVRALLRRRKGASPLDAPTIALAAAGLVCAVVGLFVDDRVQLTASAWYFIGIGLIAWLVTTRTIVGRRLYAVGGNAEAARLAGVSVNRYRIVAFVLSGAAAGFVGALYAAQNATVTPTALNGFELTVIAAAILGGVSLFGGSGSVLKSMVGALILFTINNGFNTLNLGTNYQQLIQGAIIIASAAIYTISAKRVRHRQPHEVSTTADPPAVAR